MLKDRLEKIQQVMNQAALAGLDVEHLDEQKTILEDIKKMRAERSKALREEVQARRATSTPASARGSSRYQQDLEAGMHPRTAKRLRRIVNEQLNIKGELHQKGQLKVSTLTSLERRVQTPTSTVEVVKGQRRSARCISNKNV